MAGPHSKKRNVASKYTGIKVKAEYFIVTVFDKNWFAILNLIFFVVGLILFSCCDN